MLTLQLPVTASVREVMAALAQEDGWTKGQVLVKVNSAGDAIGLQPDARGVATSLGLNERLFVVNPQEVHELVGTGSVPGPREDRFFGGGRGGAEGRSQRGGGSWLWLLLRLKGEEKGVGLS